MPNRATEPNVIIPLAASYNTRGIDANANSLTNDLDQRKVNSFYETIINPLSKGITNYLVNRPGVTMQQTSTFGSSSQTAQLLVTPPNARLDDSPWLFALDGISTIVSDAITSTNILSSSNARVRYVDKTNINNNETVVLQLGFGLQSSQRVFYASSVAIWTEITHSTFTAFNHRGKMEFLDGFGLILSSSNRIYNTNLNTISTWPAGNFITKQIKQDYAVGLARLRNQILAFGEETIEVFYNAGLSPAPLGRIPSLHQRIGLNHAPVAGTAQNGTHYYATLENRIYFPGNAPGPQGLGIYSYDGQRFEKVSRPIVDKILIGANARSVESITFQGRQAVAIRIDDISPGAHSWLMFFPQHNEWFEWRSSVFYPINQGIWFLGLGTSSNRIYSWLGASNWTDVGVEYTMVHQFKLPSNGERREMKMWGVTGDTARVATDLSFEFSDDDQQTWTSTGTIDISQTRKMAFRGGSFYERFIRMSHTASTEIRLENFISRIE